MKNNTIVATSFLAALLLNSCEDLAPLAQVLSSPAKSELKSHEGKADTWIVNGEFDYGFQILPEVINNGEQGDVNITVTLSCSEGEWTRNQTLNFDANETKNLSYVFTEPTVNATNLQYRVVTLP